MQKVWKIRVALIIGLAVVGMGVITSQQQANARPKYIKVFAKTYPELGKLAKTAKCLVCHPKKSKKTQNSYAKAMKLGLPKKNCKDLDAIKKALVAAESKPSDVKGKTFGELIKAGKLPNAKK
ncbi:hypothetical protein MNBD_PLANCTO02-2664 [hydrothermal vent metagenome]|uniref:Cytochrome c domain-containing protein n=1 Tax=hydrothermal vent metagenome TaxID=652676 RepID=A0A3B1E1U9_9ZZZZ